MTNDEQKELFKEAYKEAAKEWLTECSAAFGKWAFFTILGGVIVALGYVMLTAAGWHK